MSINATLLGQMITFAIFVWFTMKFVWPPVMKAMSERKDKIADGLAAGERGHKELELSQKKALEQLHQAREEAAVIVEKANRRGKQIIEEAKATAQVEAKRVLEMADQRIAQEVSSAKRSLQKEMASLAVLGAEKIIEKNLDKASNEKFISNVISNLS